MWLNIMHLDLLYCNNRVSLVMNALIQVPTLECDAIWWIVEYLHDQVVYSIFARLLPIFSKGVDIYSSSLHCVHRDEGPPLQLHTFSLSKCYPYGVGSLLWHKRLRVLIIAGPNQDDEGICELAIMIYTSLIERYVHVHVPWVQYIHVHVRVGIECASSLN